MGYYVTIRKGTRTIFALGPFNRHGDALRSVGHVHRLVYDLFPTDRDLAWVGWGTSHVKSGPMPAGRFNTTLGLPAGRIAESPLSTNRRWTEDKPPAQRVRRHSVKTRSAA